MTITRNDTLRRPAGADDSLTRQLGLDPSVTQVFDFSNPWPPVPPARIRTLAEIHADQAEAALAAFERSGDFRTGLAALIHAILSIDVTEAGNR